MHSIWFVLGLSGAGKSFFSHEAAKKMGWFHYEIDMYPHEGITHWGLCQEWDNYFKNYQIEPLIQTITTRACQTGCNGSILSFPSNLIGSLKQNHIDNATVKVKLIILSGTQNACSSSFLKREQETGRNLGLNHWNQNNLHLYPILENELLSPYKINAFNHDETHKSIDILLNEVCN